MKKIAFLKMITALSLLFVLCTFPAGCREMEAKAAPRVETEAASDEDLRGMFAAVLQKEKGKDFIILNLSDPQLYDAEWHADTDTDRVLLYTIDQLITKQQPDLITISGDLAWAWNAQAYENLAALLDSYRIPWAPVWGNHDNEAGAEGVEALAERYSTHDFCVYEKGDPAMGNGNYIIGIEEDGRIVEAVFLMDTHNQLCCQGEESSWAKLNDAQLAWYETEVQKLEEMGCHDSTLIVHIPIYAYREAFQAAVPEEKQAPGAYSLAESYTADNWREGYGETCFGVMRKGINSCSHDDGVYALLKKYGNTKHVLAGHDHTNNFSILYGGIRLTYALKTGMGCYWDEDLNGGTVLRVTENGVAELFHAYVDVRPLLSEAAGE